MTLYRMAHLRQGKIHQITFAARNAEAATRLASTWCAGFKTTLLQVKALRNLQPELELRA